MPAAAAATRELESAPESACCVPAFVCVCVCAGLARQDGRASDKNQVVAVHARSHLGMHLDGVITVALNDDAVGAAAIAAGTRVVVSPVSLSLPRCHPRWRALLLTLSNVHISK